MAVLIHKLKTMDPKKALAVVSLAGLVVFLISSPFASANGPSFNIFPICYQGGLNCDLPLLDARNISRGESYSASQADHDAGIQASPGEIIEFSVYFHNGAPDANDNVALNAMVKAFAQPFLGSSATTHTISATIGAQNASTVSSGDFSRGGNINVQIQGNAPQSLSLVPGSTVLFKDRGLNPQPPPVTMPDTVFTSGVDIGNVRGCFQYHGFVNFKVKVSEAVLGDLRVQKHVKNITQGIPFNDAEVSANPGDTVEYQILVNALNNPVPNVSVKDALNPKITPSGSVTVDGIPVNNAAFFSSSGVSIGTVNVNVSREIRFQAVVALSSQFPVGTHVLPNVATAFTSQKSAQDGANVRVVIQPQIVTCVNTWDAPQVADGSQRGLRRVNEAFNVRTQVSGLQPLNFFKIVRQHVSGFPSFPLVANANAQGNYDARDESLISSSFITGDYNVFIEVNNVNVATCRGFRIEPPVVQQIDLDKTVRNDTTGSGFADQVSAQPAERVTFRLQVSPQNSTAALQNVVLRDSLPNKLTFVAGSLNVNGTPQSEGNFFSTGISLGSISPSSQVVVTFQADVAGPANFNVGSCEILTNTGTVTATGNLSDSDTAMVQVCKQAPTKQPGSPGPRP